jgi:hypothetical protein
MLQSIHLMGAVVSGHVRGLECLNCYSSAQAVRHLNDVEDPLTFMRWCLGISEHWNGSGHPLKLMEWYPGISEH